MRYANYYFSLVLLLSSCSQLTLPVIGDRPVVPGQPEGGILQIHPSNVHSQDPVILLYSEHEGFCVIDRDKGSVRRPVPSYRTESILAALSCGLALGVATGPV